MPQIRRTFESSEHGEMQEEIACPLCDSSSAKTVLMARDLIFARPGRYPLLRCEGCGLEYVNPRPTVEALPRHYPREYFGYGLPEDVPRYFRWFSRAFAYGISMRRLGYLEKVIGRLPTDISMLDVGCGVNHLLYWIKEERGFEGLGLDFNQEIVQYVKDELQMPIVHGTLQTADFRSGQFDLVTMMEYLEHELDPRDALQQARRITRNGGTLALELPYTLGPPARLFRSVWWNLDIPRHLTFFTPQTLGRMLDECGFELVNVKPFTFPFYVGMSLIQALGQRHWIKNRRSFPILSALLGAPFLFFQWLLPEFMFAVARAK